jgi:hypothetical protein
MVFQADHVHFCPGGFYTDVGEASGGRKVSFFRAGPPG